MRPALPTTRIQDHHRLQMEDSVSALSTATLARGAIQHMIECEGCSTWFHFKCVGLYGCAWFLLRVSRHAN